MRPVSSWGRLSRDPHRVVPLADPRAVARQMQSHGRPGLAHGMGRSYGDSCLNAGGSLWLTTGLDHFLSFDAATGRVVCEAGVLLRDIQQLAVPRGWMLPVTPGTQLATVGGAIANDVHGKNHHRLGTFGDHVLGLRLVRTDGQVIDCGPQEQAPWFAATLGGLGLTGVIIQAEIQLRPVHGPWLDAETIPFARVGEFFDLADASECDWEYTVSWIDCLSRAGRGLFMRANHRAASPEDAARARPKSRKRAVPFTPPVSLINAWSLRLFNLAYCYGKNRRSDGEIVHYEPFFYPLDNLLDWNRIYGPRGFFQYQSVIPTASARDATRAMLREIAKSGMGSFLAVLKTFGNRASPGMLSFPRPGATLALDFPNQGDRTHRLFARLDTIVREAGGRIYPGKDARMPRELFEAGYPRLDEFSRYRDPGISSNQSRRLMGY